MTTAISAGDSSGESDTDHPHADQRDADQPDADQPHADEPDADRPHDAARPDADQSAADHGPDQADQATPPARFLTLLASARPADVAPVLSALPAAYVAEAVDDVQGKVSLAVREYILAESPGLVLAAFARHAVRNRDEFAENALDRILLRCDPEADTALFFLDTTLPPVLRARSVILRHRKGPDGHAVIPPQLKKALLDPIAALDINGPATGTDLHRLSELAYADDLDLVLAAAPHGAKLSADEAARVIITLDAHGRRRDAKKHRALWAGRGPGFRILGFRRFAALRAKYRPGPAFSPTAPGTGAVTLAEYRDLVGDIKDDVWYSYAPVRIAAYASLRVGTLSAADILQHTRPAALAVSLTEHDETGDWRPGFRRAADDVRALITRDASERLGSDPKAWARVIARVNGYPGTLPELLADPDPVIADRHWSWSSGNFGTYVRGDYDAVNVLLALAPRDIADRALRTRRMKRIITHAAAGAPLCRALVDFIVDHGTAPQREQLATNEATPDSVLMRLIDTTRRSEVLLGILDRELVGPEVVAKAAYAVPRDRRLREWIVETVGYDNPLALTVLSSLRDEPGWLLRALRAANAEFDEPGRIAAYVLLADVAGVEAVWAVEQERAGSLDAMAPYVRASMATGDAGPLIAAARDSPVEEYPDVPFADLLRHEEALDRRMLLPLEDLIRNHLDGRTDRWLRLADLLKAKPDASDEDLIAEAASQSDR